MKSQASTRLLWLIVIVLVGFVLLDSYNNWLLTQHPVTAQDYVKAYTAPATGNAALPTTPPTSRFVVPISSIFAVIVLGILIWVVIGFVKGLRASTKPLDQIMRGAVLLIVSVIIFLMSISLQCSIAILNQGGSSNGAGLITCLPDVSKLAGASAGVYLPLALLFPVIWPILALAGIYIILKVFMDREKQGSQQPST